MTVVEMAQMDRSNNNKTDGNSNWDCPSSPSSSERTIQAQPDPEVATAGRVTVKTDIVVRVHEEGSPGISMSDGSPRSGSGSGSGSGERLEDRFGYFLSRYPSAG